MAGQQPHWQYLAQPDLLRSQNRKPGAIVFSSAVYHQQSRYDTYHDTRYDTTLH